MANDEFIIELVADANGVIKAIKKQVEDPQVKKAGASLGDTLVTGLKTAGKGAGLAGAIATAGLAATGLIVAGIGKALGSAIDNFVVPAMAQTEAVDKLNSSLAVTGNFSKATSLDIQNFAKRLEQSTTFTDEAVMGQIAFAQQMGASVEQSKEIAAAATDMAKALDMDLNSAVRNVSKTLGGYAGELGEVIPELKNLSMEQLQAGEGVNLLAKKFAGFAELEANTFSGKLEQVSNAFTSVKQSIGSTITESGIVIAIFDLVKGALDRFTKNIDFTPLINAIKTVSIGLLKMSETVLLLSRAAAKFMGSEGMAGFFTETEVAVRTLRQQIQGLKQDDLDRFAKNRENALVEKSALAEKMNQINKLAEAERKAAEQKKKLDEEQKKRSDEMKKKSDDFVKNLKTNFIGGITSGFEAMGAAFVNGGNGFEEFGNIALKTLGQLAVQTGSFLILTGAGMSGVGAFLGLSGGAAIAAGIGLTILGGAIMAMAGRGGKKGSASAPSGASTSGSGGGLASSASAGGIVGENNSVSYQGNEQMEKQASVSLTVNGSIFDSDTTGTRIIELLQDELDYKNGRVG